MQYIASPANVLMNKCSQCVVNMPQGYTLALVAYFQRLNTGYFLEAAYCYLLLEGVVEAAKYYLLLEGVVEAAKYYLLLEGGMVEGAGNSALLAAAFLFSSRSSLIGQSFLVYHWTVFRCIVHCSLPNLHGTSDHMEPLVH